MLLRKNYRLDLKGIWNHHISKRLEIFYLEKMVFTKIYSVRPSSMANFFSRKMTTCKIKVTMEKTKHTYATEPSICIGEPKAVNSFVVMEL
jgi:hypothetical protein